MTSEALLPYCTIVICTRDRPALLSSCLEAIRSLQYPHYETIVVDNAPSDGLTTREVARQFQARYVLEKAPGLSRARNAGMRKAQGEIVAYLDDDAIPDPCWLHHLVPEFKDPTVMAVTGPVMFRSKGHTDVPSVSNLGPRRVWGQPTPKWFESACFGGIGLGSNMAFRRSSIAFWPGFNERLGRGTTIGLGEENFAFYELIRRGYSVCHTPLAVVYHPLADNTRLTLADLRSSLAYVLMVLFESNDKLRALRYLLERLNGVERQGPPDKTPGPAYPFPKLVSVSLGGLMCYLRSRPFSKWTRAEEDH